MVELLDFRPVDGMESVEVNGCFDHGWFLRLRFDQRIAMAVQSTCCDTRLRRYVAALAIVHWDEHAWTVDGTCTFIATCHPTAVRGWFYVFYACWVLLQAVMGKHQLNIPHTAAWRSLQQGGGMAAIAASACTCEAPQKHQP